MLQVDFLIFGAGVAGLCMAAKLKSLGYSVLVAETDKVGGWQSLASQGMIHGGIKYALNGSLNSDSEAIKGMPDRWRQMLSGESDIQLTNTKAHSDYQHIWSTGNVAHKFASFFASKLLRGRVDPLERNDYPHLLQEEAFKGSVYKINDVVIDLESMAADFYHQLEQSFIHIQKDGIQFSSLKTESDKDLQSCTLKLHDGSLFEINCQSIIFSAGEGNQALIDTAGLSNKCSMQLRPLKQVAVHKAGLPTFFGHCIGTSSKPRITVSSHFDEQGVNHWYLGGEIAENAINMSDDDIAKSANKTLKSIFPWIDWSDATYSSFFINRAEPKQKNEYLKPECAYLHPEDPFIIAWPTKLALSPDLADRLAEWVKSSNIKPLFEQPSHECAKPPLGTTPWLAK